MQNIIIAFYHVHIQVTGIQVKYVFVKFLDDYQKPAMKMWSKFHYGT